MSQLAINVALETYFGESIAGPAPNAPSSLVVEAEWGYSRTRLSWTDNSDNETGFKIERSPDGSAWAQIDTTAAGINYYTDSGLTRGNPYYYRVRAYNAGGNSAYSNTDNDTIFQLSDVTLFADYDANAGVYEDSGGTDEAEDADLVWVWKDQANSYDLTQATSGDRPTFKTGIINSLPVIRFNAAHYMKAATAADWKFLHDGTQFGVYIVWATTDVQPDANYVLIDTGGLSSLDTGLALWFDDRSGSSRDDLMRIQITKGASGQFEVQGGSLDESARSGEWHITSSRLTASDFELRNDGQFGAEYDETPTGTPSAGNPSSALTVGARRNDTVNFKGDIARILVVSGAVSDTEHKEIETFLAEEYDLFNISYFGTETVVEHDVPTFDHNAFVGLAQAANGNLIMAYNKSSTHASYDGDLIVRTSTDEGDTWGAETILWDYSVDGGGTDHYRIPAFTKLSDDRLILTFTKIVSGSFVTDAVGYYESDDNGASWTGPTFLNNPFTDHSLQGAGVLELANGDLLYPYYGKDSGETFTSCAVMRSQDNGDSWSFLATIADGESEGRNNTETGLVLLGNGDILALIRDSTNNILRVFESDNSGATWAGKTTSLGSSLMVNARGLPGGLLLSTGEIIACIRRLSADDPDERASILFSADNGVSWQLGHHFIESPTASGGRMTYGQFVEDDDGTIYLAYGHEDSGQTISDVLFVKTSW